MRQIHGNDALVERLRAAMAIDTRFEFLEALGDLDPRYTSIDFPECPAPLSWFGRIFHLFLMTAGQGISHYVLLDGDVDFHDVLDACRRMGAARTVAHLEAAASFFPRGKVPVADRERYKVLRRMDQTARDTGTTSPGDLLDKESDDAMDALADDVRSWVMAHQAEVEEMLRNVPSPVLKTRSEVEQLEAALVSVERLLTPIQDRRTVRRQALRAAAERHGLLPWHDKGVDPAVVRFFQATERFGQDEWLVVAQRKLAAPRKFESATREADETTRLFDNNAIIERVYFSSALAAVWKVRKASLDNVRTMPIQVIVDGKPIGLMVTANDALIAASICLAQHDWMMFTPDGVKAARVLYGLFDGLAPCPELPTAPKRRR